MCDIHMYITHVYLHKYTYVYHACIFTCIHICISHMYIYIYKRMARLYLALARVYVNLERRGAEEYIYMYTHMYITHVYLHVYTYVYHTCIFTYINICISHKYIYIHTHMYITHQRHPRDAYESPRRSCALPSAALLFQDAGVCIDTHRKTCIGSRSFGKAFGG